MEKAVIIDNINKTIGELTGDKREREPYESLKEDCGLDSLSLVNLIVSLEEEFGITFDDGDLDPAKIVTLNDLLELTEKYI
jgi:acyl carrier protein